MKENALAKELRVKHRLKLGGYGDRAVAPNGEPYVVLQGVCGEDGAKKAFTEYRNSRPGGAVWWRVVPEIRSCPGAGETFYMRLLIVAEASHAPS